MTWSEEDILEFVRKELHCNRLNIDSSLSTGEHLTVQEDVYELIDKYVDLFGVDCSDIKWRRYFPVKILPFLPNYFLPALLQSDRHKPAPFTIRMLVESANAGRWLYD